MKLTTIKWNIGLGNNPFTKDEINKIFSQLFSRETAGVETTLHKGEWNGQPELTAVVSLTAPMNTVTWLKIANLTQAFCHMFHQDAIPVTAYNFMDREEIYTEDLVYRKGYEGEQHTFDRKFFID